MRSRFFPLSLLFVPASLLEAQEKVDLSVIHRIKEEAFQRSQVMDNLFYLTDVHGPRLSFSPGYAAAADWAVARLKEWGLSEAHHGPRSEEHTSELQSRPPLLCRLL